MKNYFRGTAESPYHISIGGVLVNDKKQIASHHFEHISSAEWNFKDIYLLMRETIEPNESIEIALSRGLMEEMGAKATLERYLGAQIDHYTRQFNNTKIQKTTLYFLCRLCSFDINKRREGDPEGHSEVVWLEPEELILKMKDQFRRYHQEDVNEAGIIERAQKWI